MILDSIYGQSVSVPRLIERARQGRIAHALLLAGPEGCGKRTLAFRIAQILYCRADAPDKPCGVCEPCLRFAGGNHPDAFVLRAEKASIGVDAVRALLPKLEKKPFEGGMYTVRVEQADRMTPQAQNALLKTLEEPVTDVVFLLTSDAPDALLPTIRSRCREIRLSIAPTDAVRRALTLGGVSPERATVLASLSGGLIGRAWALERDEKAWQAMDTARRAMLEARVPSGIAQAARTVADLKEYAPIVLAAWETLLRDLLLLRLGVGDVPLFHEDLRPLLETRAADFTASRLSGMIECVASAARMLKSNVPWAAAAERVLWKMWE